MFSGFFASLIKKKRRKKIFPTKNRNMPTPNASTSAVAKSNANNTPKKLPIMRLTELSCSFRETKSKQIC